MSVKNFAFIIIVLSVFSCKKEIIITAGYGLDDWSSSSHGSQADPDYDLVFPQDKVERLDIVIEDYYWDVMQKDLANRFAPGAGYQDEEPVYVPCQLFFNGKQWYDVGIRYKGNSSLSSAYREGIKKLPFRLEFSHFEDENPAIAGQTFYGFSQLSLGNNFKDQSFLHEKIATDVFRSFGVPAPQSAFYRIYIDYGDGPIYFGLYTMLEIVFDDAMLLKQFGTNTGNCYKPEGDGARLNNINLISDKFFVNKTNTGAPLDDIIALTEVLISEERLSDPEDWRNELENIFDIDLFLKWLAANTSMQNWDTYGNMTHNFYLYNDPADGLLKWIPWDNNEAFADGPGGGGPGGPGLNNVQVLNFDFSNLDNSLPSPDGIHTWPLIRYLYDDVVFRNKYVQYINEFISGPFDPSALQEKFTLAHHMISPYITGDEGEIQNHTFLKSPDDFNASLNEIINFVYERKALAEDFINN